MIRSVLLGLVATTGIAACGGDDPVIRFPLPQGSLTQYFPLKPGDRFLYRLNGDPDLTAELLVRDGGAGLLQLELISQDGSTPRIALLTRTGADRIDVLQVDRGAVRLELDPALAALQFPLQEGRSFSSATLIEVVGAQLGINLLGVSDEFGPQVVLQQSYPRTFSVEVSVQTDLVGRSRLELELADGIGPVAARLVSPAAEMLGLEGLELRLELLERN